LGSIRLKRYIFFLIFLSAKPKNLPHLKPPEMKRTNGGVPVATAAWAAEWCLEYHRIMARYSTPLGECILAQFPWLIHHCNQQAFVFEGLGSFEIVFDDIPVIY